jgi:predicted TIM-barrel fold metal-dependent hydrolase
LSFHIGTGGENVVYRGPGGAVVNYMETTYPGMRVVSHMVASGALDKRPDLKILIAEGGAAWVPAIGDRMDEAYRQHGMFVRPKLDRLPSEIVRHQVYTPRGDLRTHSGDVAHSVRRRERRHQGPCAQGHLRGIVPHSRTHSRG